MAEADYSFTVRVQKSNRVSIPKFIREEFNVKEGSLVKLVFVKKVKG